LPPPSGSFCDRMARAAWRRGRGRGWRSMTWTDCCSTGPSHASELAQIDHCIACGRGPWKHLPARGHVSAPGATRFFCGGGGWRGEPRAASADPSSIMDDGLQKATASEPFNPGPVAVRAPIRIRNGFFAVIFSFHPYRRERERGRACSNYDTVPTTEHEGQCRRPWIDLILVELAGLQPRTASCIALLIKDGAVSLWFTATCVAAGAPIRRLSATISTASMVVIYSWDFPHTYVQAVCLCLCLCLCWQMR
jgi:hypothetical protein